MKNIYLVTGASGFVGACITHRLVEMGKTVHVVSRKTGNWRLKSIEGKIHMHTVDLLDDSLPHVIEKIKPQFVFHLAAFGSLPAEEGLEKMIKTNVLGTANLLRGLDREIVKLVVNTGSSSEYGVKDSPLNENDVLTPINDYALSKVSQTLLCQKEALTKDLPIITFRLFSPFGMYEDKTRLISYVVLKALRNEDILLSNPSHVRDFIFVEDVVNAYLQATNCKPINGDIVNIGSGKQHTTEEVVKTIIKITKSSSKVIWNGRQKQLRQAEPNMWEADVRKAKATLDWQPTSSLEEGLKKTISWYQNHLYLYA